MVGRNGGGRGSTSGPSQPMSVEQIVQEAQNFDYNPLIPLKYWIRSAGTLLKEAEIYEHEGNDQQTYLLLFRHAQLVLGHLAKHPDAKSNEAGLRQAEEDVHKSLETMERLKPRINKKYERYQKFMRDREAMGISSSRKPSSASVTELPAYQKEKRRIDPAIAGSETLAAADNRDLAVKLAHKEIARRATARKATRRAGISEEEEQERRTAGVWGNWERDFASDHTGVDGDALSKQMQNIRLQFDERGKRPSAFEPQRPSFQPSRGSYNYPSVPTQGKRQSTSQPSTPRPQRPEKEIGLVESLTIPPPPPPKDEIHTKAPPRPIKQPLAELESPATTTLSPTSTASTEPELKSSSFTFKPAAYLENGTPLRTIFLPPDLRHQFVKIAEKNTRANLETCGILCGTLISNALFISKLVIPEQKSTSDTCETVDENLLFDYVDGEELMMLGWIHTHPTQTCFMSSRDLHTHSGYQVMMPESIAIVCAPSKNEWGVYRLTDPPGMPSILNCTKTGLFHPHDSNNLYTDALRPGHVFEAKGLEFDVHDMRSKR